MWMQDFAVRTETKARVDCSEQSDWHAVPRWWNIENIETVSIRCETLWNLWFHGRASDVLMAQKFQTCWMIVAFFESGLLIAQIVRIARECYFDENPAVVVFLHCSITVPSPFCKVKPCLILSTLTSWMMRAPLIGKVLLRHLAMQMHCRYTERQHMRSWIVRIEVWFQNLPIIGAWPVGQCQCSLCGRSRNTVSQTFSAFCLGPRQRTSAQVPIVNRLVELGVRRFCIAAYKARSGEHTCQCPSVTVCWWMWSMSNWIDLPFLNLIGFFHYRWLWQRSVCGSSRKASTASDTQRSSKILVNLIHVVHFGNLWNNDIYVYHIVMYESYSFKATI